MARWSIEYLNHDFTVIEQMEDLLDPVVVLKKKGPSSLTCQFALGDPLLTRDLIAPKRTDFVLYRGTTPVLDGELWERSLSGETDKVTVDHQSYEAYMAERVYPRQYPWVFGDWLKKWVGQDLTTIAEDFMQALVDDPDGNGLPLVFSNGLTGIETTYEIHFSDQTNIIAHLDALAERDDGFDYWFRRSGDNVRFTMVAPTNDTGDPIYVLTNENAQIVPDTFQWKDMGPEATWTLGMTAGTKNRQAWASTYVPSLEFYRKRDSLLDTGIREYAHMQRVTAAEGYRQRFPQKECSFQMLVDTARLPNFWAQSLGRPRSMLGKRVHVGPIVFQNFHTVDADFKIQDITIEPDQDGNDYVAFGLDMING